MLKNEDGQDVTEYSIGVSINGKEIDIPTLVPGLTSEEVSAVLKASSGNGKLPDSVVKKAVEHAKKRLSIGKSPFAETENYSRK